MGQMTLPEMREMYVATALRLAALKAAHGAGVEQRNELAMELRTATYAGQDTTELKADCLAVVNRLKAIDAEMQPLRQRLDSLNFGIRDYYTLAGEDIGPKVDWSFQVSSGDVWKGWGSRWVEGKIVTVDKELCEPELLAIGAALKSVRVELQPPATSDQRYCLRIKYPAYRDMAWSDYDGQKIAESIVKFVATHEVLDDLVAFLAEMGVQ